MDEIEQALSFGSFFVAPPGSLRVERVHEEVPWEIFQGHLLTGTQTRETASFESWHLFHDLATSPAGAPLISVRLDRGRRQIHVVRQILTYGFEAYEDTPGVILTRPAQKWVAELVGTIRIGSVPTDQLAAEIGTYVFLAVIGTSRLPITSLESPLPTFSLGQIGYVPRLAAGNAPLRDPVAFLSHTIVSPRPRVEQAKALETALRSISANAVPHVSDILWHAAKQQPDCDWLPALFRRLFHGVALSPYTQFASRLIDTLLELARPGRLGNEAVADILGMMLRHLCRHLTAFDLVTFHNLGANYPDALFLDAILKAYLHLLENAPNAFLSPHDGAHRRRRRALRQACLVRKIYEAHHVPDAPTSTGENSRVLPAPFTRVPAEQITQEFRRRRVLYDGEPVESLLSEDARAVLAASFDDLAANPCELRELGMASFLDRPLGACKLPSEVDRTPLVACEALSRSIAARRLERAHASGWLSNEKYARLTESLSGLSVTGISAIDLPAHSRAGVVSLTDAAKAASDFVLIRSMPGALAELWSRYDWLNFEVSEPPAAASLTPDAHVLLVSVRPAQETGGHAILRLLDRSGNPLLEFAFGSAAAGQTVYLERGGVELVTRLRVLRYWPEPGTMCDLSDRPQWIELRR